ncbi:Mbeg1-like protein [Lachnobacterium bovis]|uniref:Mbeg1-like protein n=1 Tax=Lachnobacterium bovis TaxID=140626 RepID=UPI0003B6EC5A|nr:Mbeg1-like protein [Lachnobacterium bovis]
MKKKIICSVLMLSLCLGESNGLVYSNYNPLNLTKVEAKQTQTPKKTQNYSLENDQLKFLDEFNSFLVENENLKSLSGKMKKSLKKTEKMTYVIQDDTGILLDKGNVITNKKKFVINKPAMTMGKNILILKKNDKVETQIDFIASQGTNIDKLLIDKNDTDHDGVINYLEDYYHLNKANADSDHDGISDYTELMTNNLDPLKAKSNGKTFDGDLDSDNDGVKNSEEIKRGTEIDNSDLDNTGHFSINPLEENKISIRKKQNNIVKLQNANSLNPNADEDKDGLINSQDPHPFEWDVCDRDLAIFAGLSYEDGSNKIGSMYKASDIGRRPGEDGERVYFLNAGSINSNGIDNGISTEWQIVDYENKETMIDTKFSATTFKNGNNVVIAYRGTDDAYGEWINNIIGVGIFNYHSEESEAKKYALRIAQQYPNANIYVTGHSLGGYLAQIGTAELAKNNIEVKKAAYFNGIGLKYNKLLFWTKNEAMDKLKNYAARHELISYEIKGDVVSAIGVHCGKIITFSPSKDAILNNRIKYSGKNSSQTLSNISTNILGALFKANFNQYYKEYQSSSMAEYFHLTHETTSFYYNLFQGNRKV